MVRAAIRNPIELQNGVVGHAHANLACKQALRGTGVGGRRERATSQANANLFIPSILCGSAETETGKVSQEKNITKHTL